MIVPWNWCLSHWCQISLRSSLRTSKTTYFHVQFSMWHKENVSYAYMRYAGQFSISFNISFNAYIFLFLCFSLHKGSKYCWHLKISDAFQLFCEHKPHETRRIPLEYWRLEDLEHDCREVISHTSTSDLPPDRCPFYCRVSPHSSAAIVMLPLVDVCPRQSPFVHTIHTFSLTVAICC